MRPIEQQAGIDFAQAVRCVEFRTPATDKYRGDGFGLALALRYGLVGAATAHHLFLEASCNDEPYLSLALDSWPETIEAHVREAYADKLGDPVRDMPAFVARWATNPALMVLPQRRMLPLATCLHIAADNFELLHAGEIRKPWRLWERRRAMRAFDDDARESVRYAVNYFERRQLGLDELREIALLDE